MKLSEAIVKRRSVHSFINKKVKLGDLIEAIDSANQAPFAGNINNLKFLIVKEQKIKEKIAGYADQKWINDADTIIVVCSNPEHLLSQYDERGDMYSRQHAGAAIQNILLALTDRGIASCWVGAFLEKGIKTLLLVPESYRVEAIIPIGYTKEKAKKPRKAPLESSMFWEKWGVDKKPENPSDPRTW